MSERASGSSGTEALPVLSACVEPRTRRERRSSSHSSRSWGGDAKDAVVTYELEDAQTTEEARC